MNVALLDISKAFDSVSHNSLLIAAHRLGIPLPFLNYLHEFYSRSTTCIKVKGSTSEPTSVCRGVKQGDPMSVNLFNAVIDWALSSLDNRLGINLADGAYINHLAFADDIGLLSRTPTGLQSQINMFSEHLTKCGLYISAGQNGKSASMRINVDGKRKKWVVNPSDYLCMDGNVISVECYSNL